MAISSAVEETVAILEAVELRLSAIMVGFSPLDNSFCAILIALFAVVTATAILFNFTPIAVLAASEATSTPAFNLSEAAFASFLAVLAVLLRLFIVEDNLDTTVFISSTVSDNEVLQSIKDVSKAL